MEHKLTPNEKKVRDRRRRASELDARRQDRNLHLSLSEGATEVGVSEQTIRRMISRGELEAIHLHNRVFVHRDDVDRLNDIRNAADWLGLGHEWGDER
jgi:excisionase family DNA binding protein